MIVFIQSYAHCERLGIKPCDSIINTVIDTEKPRTILAYSKGHTHLAKDNVEFDTHKCFVFDNLDQDDIETITIDAKNLECAKLLFQNNYHGNFEIWEKFVRFKTVGEIHVHA